MLQQTAKIHQQSYGSATNDAAQSSTMSTCAAQTMHQPNSTFYASTKVKPGPNHGGIVLNRNLVVKLDQKGNQMTQASLHESQQLLNKNSGF